MSEIEKSLYVDDLVSRGENEMKAEQLKTVATEIFADTTFDLHKWHSNARELELYNKVEREEMETFAKQQLRVSKVDQASILGLPWNKEADTIGVNIPSGKTESTKRGILGKVAKIYDSL